MLSMNLTKIIGKILEENHTVVGIICPEPDEMMRDIKDAFWYLKMLVNQKHCAVYENHVKILTASPNKQCSYRGIAIKYLLIDVTISRAYIEKAREAYVPVVHTAGGEVIIF